MIKPWIFDFFTLPEENDGQSEAERCAAAYAWYLDLWTRAEPIGFEGIFFSEHHFVPGRLSPSPNLLIAAVAQRTTTLRLGAMGQVLPLYEPWRVAEELSMLDHLSQGRLEIGLSSGSGPMEFRAVGMLSEEIRPRFSEALDILDAALTQPQFSHEGKFWKLNKLAISPRPLQQPLPPRWITGLSTQTAAMAAERGYKLCTAFFSIADIKPIFEAYRTTAANGGKTAGSDRLGLRRMIFISDNDSEGRDIARAAVNKWRSIMSGPPPAKTGAAAHMPNAHKAMVPDAPHAQQKGAQHGQAIGDEEAIGGSPSAVAEQIIEQCRAVGAGHMLGYTFGGLSKLQIERSYELWRQVIPVLRKAKID